MVWKENNNKKKKTKLKDTNSGYDSIDSKPHLAITLST